MPLPAKFAWLRQEKELPKVIQEALKLYGTKEIVGAKHNPVILAWADELGIGQLVNDDEQAWCGLAAAICLKRAGKIIPLQGWDLLRALKYQAFGNKVTQPMLGDVLVFGRNGGGHVGFYMGESAATYFVLGGNQNNQFNITEIKKDRLVAARRPDYTKQPASVRKILISPSGKISTNEA